MSRHSTPAALVPDLRSLAERIDRLERGGGTNGFPSGGDFGSSQAMLEFPAITVTTPTVSAGSTWSGSFEWDAVEGGRTVLVRAIRVEHSTPSHLNFRILRRAKFSTETDRMANTAFAARETGEGFMREHLWDYTDEDGTGRLHVWVENIGLATAEFTISLNERTPQ